MSEFLVTAGVVAAACSSIFETWNERSRYHALTRSVSIRHIPRDSPEAQSFGAREPTLPTNLNTAATPQPPAAATPPPSTAESTVAKSDEPAIQSPPSASDTYDDGIRISRGGEPTLPPVNFAPGYPGCPTCASGWSPYGWGFGPMGWYNRSLYSNAFSPVCSSAGCGYPYAPSAFGFPFHPIFPMMGLASRAHWMPGKQTYRNPDGSYTEVSVGGTTGLEETRSTWLSRKIYYYGLVPAAAVWRTHRVCSMQAPFLNQIGMWRSCMYLGWVIPFQTVYTVCIINTLAQWLSTFNRPPQHTPTEGNLGQVGAEGAGFWDSGVQDPLKRQLGFDDSAVTLYGNQSGVSMNMTSPGQWLSRTSTSLVWNFAVWPGLVFLGTAFVTIPAATLGARIAFGLRLRNRFATGGPLAPFGV